MWRELQAAAQNDLILPGVVAERCVHTRMEKASCRACVDACPRDAWVIGEDMLGIDGDKCDGCDLCVPACPQGAIEARFFPSLKATEQGGIAFAACEYAGVEKCDEGFVSCLHALGMTDLLALRRDGASILITSCGDCGRCERGGVQRMEQRLDEANAFLVSRGLEPLKHRNLEAGAWVKAFSRARELVAARTLNRRAFFRNALKLPKERMEAAFGDLGSTFVPPGMLLEGGTVDALFPFVPEIDPARCNGCDACLRLCPQEAIQFAAEDQGGPAFLIHAERCSGCKICADVCDQDAVSIASMSRSVESRIPLYAGRCSACGIDFHVPAAGMGSERSCWVCAVRMRRL